MRRARLGERGRDLFVAGHVDFAEYAADLARDLFAPLAVAVENRDLGAALASSRAVASPRPDAAPVTTAATPLISMLLPLRCAALRSAYALNVSQDKTDARNSGDAALSAAVGPKLVREILP